MSVVADHQEPLPARKARWYVPTPAKFLAAVLLMQFILFVSPQYQWFWFNKYKGNTVLFTVAATAIGLLLIVGWALVSRFTKWKAQFSLATMLMMVPLMAIPCAWMAREMEMARLQRKMVAEIEKQNGQCAYDTGGFPPLNPATGPNRPQWLATLLGHEFFDDVYRVRLPEADNSTLELVEGFSELRSVTVESYGSKEINEEGLKHVKNLRYLQYLPLHGVRTSDAGLAHLTKLVELREIDLRYTQITDDGLKHLKGLRSLRVLWLPPQVTDAGLAHLVELTRLEELELSRTQVTDVGLAHLMKLPLLRKIQLNQTQITGEGLAYLHGLANLQDLRLCENPMTDAGLECLEGFKQLKTLALQGPQIQDGSLRHLTALSQLNHLYLLDTNVTDAGLEHLKGLKQLNSLSIGCGSITDDGLVHLAGLDRLSFLSLRGTHVTDSGLAQLQTLPYLRWLTLTETPVTSAGLAQLSGLKHFEDIRIGDISQGEAGSRPPFRFATPSPEPTLSKTDE